MTTTLWITDVFCRTWIAAAMDALSAIKGVRAICVEPDTGRAEIDHVESVTSSQLLEALRRRGLDGRIEAN